MVTTEDNSPTTAPAKTGLHRRLWVWATVLATPVLLFFAASIAVNETRIPAGLRQLPPDWAGTSSRAQTGAAPGQTMPPADDSGREFAFPVAHRTRGDGPIAVATTEEGDATEEMRAAYRAAYNAFLEAVLRERPELDGARLYLEISRRFRTTEDGTELRRVWLPQQGRPRPGEPLPQEETQWLISHSDMVDSLLRFAESSGLPMRTREDIARDPSPLTVPAPDPLLLILGSRVLSAEGWRRIEADEARALRCWRAAIRVAVQQSSEPIETLPLVGAGTLDEVVRTLAAWVGEGNASPEGLAGLRPTLAEVHRVVFRPGWVAEEEQRTYPIRRQSLIAECDRQPWKSRLFGWVVDDPAREKEFYFSPGIWNIKRLPDVLNIALNAQIAMRNKRETPRLLSEMDEAERETIRRSQLTWPELSSADKWDWPHDNPFLDRLVSFDPASAVTIMLPKEARLNLLRAAIEWRLAPADAKPDPATMKIADRESPWRDPFAEATLRAMALPDLSGMRLYSLGSDLKDQQGQIEYDPTNGTVSPGDLTLEVK